MSPKLAELTKNLDKFDAQDQLQFYWVLARLCLGVGDAKEGLHYGREAAKLAPNSLPLRMFLLQVARAGKDVQAGQELLAEIQKLEKNGPVSLYAAAVVDVIRHQADGADTLGDAKQKLLAAGQQRKRWSDIPVMQGVIARIEDDPDAMINYYRRAIELGDLNSSVVTPVVNSMYKDALSLDNQSQAQENLLSRSGHFDSQGAGTASRLATGNGTAGQPSELQPPGNRPGGRVCRGSGAGVEQGG